MSKLSQLFGFWLLPHLVSAAAISARDYPSDEPLAKCPGYRVESEGETHFGGYTANLKLAGTPCNVYGTDLDNLVLEVTYETG
jgi:alpha-glucosidase